jgi:hypothetical protein
MTSETPEARKATTMNDTRIDRLREGWSVPKPETITRATAAPAAVALGVTLIAFGGLTSSVVSVVGALLTAGALVHWLTEMHDAAEE